MGHVLDDDSDDVAPEDGHRGRDPTKTISSLGWAEWKGAMSANVKALAKEQKADRESNADKFCEIEGRLAAGDVKFSELEKTVTKWGAYGTILLILIETTLLAGGVAASAGWLSRPTAAESPPAHVAKP